MMRLSDLQSKNIVNVINGKNIGNIIDVNISMDGTIEYLILETNKNLFSFNRDADTKINWRDITKIGEDVILVNTKL
ncbi:MAG: YlmC/YmxH family sporulation protein [Firmicutes bacterium]|nr:YlmC/YmxH family sporulation protein [Bacillota bacterium]